MGVNSDIRKHELYMPANYWLGTNTYPSPQQNAVEAYALKCTTFQ